MNLVDPVIHTFYQLVSDQHFAGFNDQKLREIAKAFNKDAKEVVRVIARFLLFNFKTNPKFKSNSEILTNEYGTLARVYLQVASALFQKEDLYHLPAMKELFKKSSQFKKTQREIIEEIKQEAVLVHEYLLTFPDWYRLESKPLHEQAERIYTFLNLSPEQRQNEDVSNLNSFFFKHIALFVGGVPLTWEDVTQRWVREGGSLLAIESFRNKLLWNKIIIIQYSENKGDPGSLKQFIINQTIEQLEISLQFRFDEKTRSELEEKCNGEQFRMDIVFLIGNPQIDEKSIKDGPAKDWIIASLRFCQMKQQWMIPDECRARLFRYCLKASDNGLSTPHKKKPIVPSLVFAEELAASCLSQEIRESAILPLLNVIQHWKREHREEFLKKFSPILNSTYFGPISLEELLRFLKQEELEKDLDTPFTHLVRYLKDVRVEEPSCRFFSFLFETLNEYDVEKAKQIPFSPHDTSRALQHLQNVAIIRRLEAITNAELSPGIKQKLLQNSSPRDGQIATLVQYFNSYSKSKKRISLLEIFNLIPI